MWGRKKEQDQQSPRRLYVTAEELQRASANDGGEHVALVGRIFSTGDRYDGYFESEDWSGPGRELHPFFWWARTHCDADGSLHDTFGAAVAEARTHTTDVLLTDCRCFCRAARLETPPSARIASRG